MDFMSAPINKLDDERENKMLSYTYLETPQLKTNPQPEPQALDPDGARNLAAAILLQACKDAGAGDDGARDWLQDDNGGIFYAEILGFDTNAVSRWIGNGYMIRAPRYDLKNARPIYETCQYCGKPNGTTRKYCSDTCAQRKYRRKKFISQV